MPKRNNERSITGRGEANLARRVAYMREARGWSYETLARAMTDVGCSISKAALYNIENGTPPRRITVDELVALAAVFEVGDVSEMLVPMESVLTAEARELLAERRAAQLDIISGVDRLVDADIRYLELQRKTDEASVYQQNLLDHLQPRTTNAYTSEHVRLSAESPAGKDLVNAYLHLVDAMAKYAGEQAGVGRG